MICVNDLVNMDEHPKEFSGLPADTDKFIQLGASSGIATADPFAIEFDHGNQAGRI